MQTSPAARRKSKIRTTRNDRLFTVCNTAFMVLLMISILYPFWDLLVESFNNGYANGLSRLWPTRPTLANYAKVLGNRYIWSGYRETLIITAAGTFCSVLATMIGAYALSKESFPFRKFFTLMIVIPMFFGGGLIASYLWNVQLGLRNTRWVLFLPSLVNSYNLVVMRNFFSGVPKELEESAFIDGASNIRTLFVIYLPVSLAVIATVTLWEMVSYWNSWFTATIYINKADRFPLQVVLRRILSEGSSEMMETDGGTGMSVGNLDNLKAATMFVCILPIMCVYPFLQKYFVKGTLVGAIKG